MENEHLRMYKLSYKCQNEIDNLVSPISDYNTKSVLDVRAEP